MKVIDKIINVMKEIKACQDNGQMVEFKPEQFLTKEEYYGSEYVWANLQTKQKWKFRFEEISDMICFENKELHYHSVFNWLVHSSSLKETANILHYMEKMEKLKAFI